MKVRHGVGGWRPGPLGKHLVPYPVRKAALIPPIYRSSATLRKGPCSAVVTVLAAIFSVGPAAHELGGVAVLMVDGGEGLRHGNAARWCGLLRVSGPLRGELGECCAGSCPLLLADLSNSQPAPAWSRPRH